MKILASWRPFGSRKSLMASWRDLHFCSRFGCLLLLWGILKLAQWKKYPKFVDLKKSRAPLVLSRDGTAKTEFSGFVKQDLFQRVSIFVNDRILFVVLPAVVEHQAQVVKKLFLGRISEENSRSLNWNVPPDEQRYLSFLMLESMVIMSIGSEMTR